jgi:DNA polymerase-3 subunit gamma/tau
MSYQVLARKWRPRTFREMVGQEHVLQALINALDHDRLHHAYLFTGTRGVGKTTIARILAKCINCEAGVSSLPCNECSACTEINEGRFVDLIEVDAASRTKVEDTRELLENVQYAPTRGRYKVYLIDEVHMLSNSSFNALLKTLEEPPPHVKFLLATTDPQKLPVTILSRCLQFNLKNMNPERIVSHLQFVLDKESVPFDDAGLWQLARSADGSMRDALSLTDQSIAFGDGKITDADVRVMLGTIDQSLVYDVLQALIAEDVKALLQAVAHLSEHSPDYSAALAELIATLHRIAIAQALPEAVDNSQGDRQHIYDFAQGISAEDVQLYYQTALLGRRDLPLVPDPRSGFEMVLLRMLAFKPQGVGHVPKKSLVPATSPDITESQSQSNVTAIPEPELSSSPPSEVSHSEPEVVEPVKKPDAAIELAEQVTASAAVLEESESKDSPVDMLVPVAEEAPAPVTPENVPVVSIPVEPVSAVVESVMPAAEKISLDDFSTDNWFTVYSSIDTGGLLQSTVANCLLLQHDHQQIDFMLDERQSTLYDNKHQQYLADLLSEYFAHPVQVSIVVGEVTGETPAKIVIRRQQERQQQAENVITGDPVVQQLQEIFDATIVSDSIIPIH